MFACGIFRSPKIILRKAVLIQGRIRCGDLKRGKSTEVGEIPKGSLEEEEEEEEAWGLGPEGR